MIGQDVGVVIIAVGEELDAPAIAGELHLLATSQMSSLHVAWVHFPTENATKKYDRRFTQV